VRFAPGEGEPQTLSMLGIVFIYDAGPPSAISERNQNASASTFPRMVGPPCAERRRQIPGDHNLELMPISME
jgi:hypothetical protein